MKSAIIYHSRYGNVSNVANELGVILKKFGGVELLEVHYANKPSTRHSLLSRIFPKLLKIVPIKTDLSEYDVVFFGISVSSKSAMTPILQYLEMASNILKKKIICIYVYAIESRARKCSYQINDILAKKGQKPLADIFIPWGNIQDVDYMQGVFNQILAALNIH
jgi:menaquinone-dependent protoporphyrinogen IX oxidase